MVALEDILQRHPVWRGGASACFSELIPSGYDELDRELSGGWPSGGLTEVLGEQEGIGELQLFVPALASLSQAAHRIVWIAPPHLPYAPALAAAGIDLKHLAVVRAPGRRDALWAAEQVLRAGPCRALIAWFPNARYAELRRLAIAAEASRALIALFRPSEASLEPSPACLRLALDGTRDVLNVRILKRRGAPDAELLALPVKRPVHALGCASSSLPADRNARAHRRLGVPVHA